jgi:hypothetical protein
VITPESLNRIAATLPDDPAQDSQVQGDIREMLKVFATLALALSLPSARVLADLWGQSLDGLVPAEPDRGA